MSAEEVQPQGMELPQAIRMTDSGLSWDDLEQVCGSGAKGMEETLEKLLEKWIEVACSQSPKQRGTGTSWVKFNRIYKHPRWFCKRKEWNRDYYEDGLYVMWWKYFWKYLCAGNPDKNVLSFYDTRHRAVPRMLVRLDGELKDLARRNIPIQIGDPGDYFAKIPAPSSAPNDAYDHILQYIESDPLGELQAVVVGRHPPGKMRQYLKLRFEHPEWTVEQIAIEINIPVATVRDPRRWQKTAKYWEVELVRRALSDEI